MLYEKNKKEVLLVNMDFIGEKLRKLRERNGWTMADVEEMTGIRQPTLSSIETNKKQPRKATVERLSQLFKIDSLFFYLPESKLLDEVIEVDEELKKFILKQDNLPYILVSKEAMEKGLSPETLRKMIELMVDNK